MDDDNLYGSSRYRYSPDRPWAASQRGCNTNNSPPSCSQVDDGLRITWGPSVNTLLGNYSYKPPASSLLGGADKTQSILAKVKRTSTNAGLASPTRPGAASTSASTSATNNFTSTLDNSNGSASYSANTPLLPTTTSRFSKRRRRLQSSTSASALTFDSPLAGSSETSREGRSLSVDETSSDMLDMLGEMARRLEASRKAALAEREKTAAAAAAAAASKVLHSSTFTATATTSASSTCVDREKSQTEVSDISRKNGKSREKIALSPACSTVLEESMSQSMAGMLLATDSGSPTTSRPILQAKDVNASNATAMALSGDKQKPASSIATSLSNPTARVEVVVPRRPLVRASSTLQPPSAASRGPLQKSRSAGSIHAQQPSIHLVPEPPVEKAKHAPQCVPSAAVDSAAEEDNFWDENDKSLELAMSQMEIPEPPSSQQQQQPQQQQQQLLLQQHRPKAAATKTELGLPAASRRDTLCVPVMAGDDPQTKIGSWEGFKSRDKRTREKSSDSSTSTVGKLSSKPLVAAQASSVKQTHASEGHKNLVPASTKAYADCSKPASKAVAATPTNGGSLLQISHKPAAQVHLSTSNSAMPSASARTLALNKSEDRIFRKFKPPTVTNAAAAKAEQEKKAAASEKAARCTGQPLAAEDAWMEDMDWSMDLEESF